MLGTLSRVPAARLLQLGECRSPDAADGQSQTVVCSGSAQADRCRSERSDRRHRASPNRQPSANLMNASSTADRIGAETYQGRFA
ncbi:hypothetical protein CXK93_21890 [Stutzerimonas decontaminans]|uniref:Uncharacterized protein n=1 Tax=Stutzerimonas decontaminans TaxID=3022791 RepID=A0ABX4VU53_9GAMM|nr:hypothetical protein CXK93_21890 [Stutzerimonas decontaminans]